jgi:glycosyltransferase involved in cell wall biosynthesis
METYARELTEALLRVRPDLQLTAFLSGPAWDAHAAPWYDLVECIRVGVDPRRRVEWVRGEQQLLPRLAKRHKLGVLHSLAGTSPAWGGFRRVVTINDLIYRVYPEAHSGIRSLGMRVLVPLAARSSHRIIVPSVSTREDVIRYLRVPPEKVDLAYDGVGATAVTPTDESALRARYDLADREVVLTLSAKRPHKNLMRLLDAWVQLAQPRPLLVMPGYPTWHEAELRGHAAALALERDVRFLGWIPPSDVEGLYRIASCFVFPSLYEGFGLPVLEAMVRGLPVACSGRTSLAEVAGNAARLFDPEDPADIAAAVSELLHDEQLRTRLIAAGRLQASDFTWEETARATVGSYERALE